MKWLKWVVAIVCFAAAVASGYVAIHYGHEHNYVLAAMWIIVWFLWLRSTAEALRG